MEKGKFGSNFGFLMAALGSAVGLGNLWGFPYKLGANGGFAFLLLYIILCVVVGYPLILGEIALGRKTQQAAIEAYTTAKKPFRFNGVLQTLVPFFLISFYCTFGGYVTKYLIASIGAFGGGALATTAGGDFFGGMLYNIPNALLFTFIFIALTMLIVVAGVSGGIEKFCKIGMPALFVMLVIMIIKGITLPGAGAGFAFMFKPDFSFLTNGQFFSVLKTAGSQMFFSLSLASACLIAYGSYLDKGENLERDAAVIAIGDTGAALFAGMAIIPAAFALGGEGAAMAGPGLLFVTMTNVFQSMGGFIGNLFQFIFWLLVFIAVLSSSIGMMEGGISAIMDARAKKGKKATRFGVTVFMTLIALAGNFMTTADALAEECSWVPWFHILGQPDVLDVWDALGEGILMPLTGLIMAIMLGWFIPGYIDDEVGLNREFKTKKFFHFCIKIVGPIFMIMIVIAQLKSFWG